MLIDKEERCCKDIQEIEEYNRLVRGLNVGPFEVWDYKATHSHHDHID